MTAHRVRIRGIVQGVGFRPTVARVARARGLAGWVCNDAEGVLVVLAADEQATDGFVEALLADLPPLARVDAVERQTADEAVDGEGFRIVESGSGLPNTGVSPDAAMCAACARDIVDPLDHRFRYPFTTCTHCGPRFSIVTGIPWDRPQTTMKGFDLCPVCAAEYHDETDRRYHAQPVACGVCGPTAVLERTDGAAASYATYSMLDPVDAVATLLQRGQIVAVKGLGGYHLCADATSDAVVTELRRRKNRPHKPLACMVRDLDVLRAYAEPTEAELTALTSPAGPIVLVAPRPDTDLAPSLAPDQRRIGFMLPTTPLHALLLKRVGKPIVCTSGNLTEEPPCIDDDDAQTRLSGIADWRLSHDRPIANRVDDSVAASIDGEVRVLRRARGYAPAPFPLPPGFGGGPRLLACGGDLKAVFALTRDRHVVCSPHLGNLDDLANLESWHRALGRLTGLLEHEPDAIAVDLHPGYRASRHGRGLAAARGLPCFDVQHHHAHLASVMGEHGHPRSGGSVLGIVLDGIGHGEEGETWGGELFVADYVRAERIATLKPVALLGGDKASVQPWRNLYAHLRASMSWAELQTSFGPLPVLDRLAEAPRALLDSMLETGTHAPLASSCGRLFDAVAAAVGLCYDQITYEGQAAMALEALIDDAALAQVREEAARGEVYPIGWPTLPETGLAYLEPVQMWRAILGDLWAKTPRAVLAARFHVALAAALARFAVRTRRARPHLDTVALSGGVFANRVLTEELAARLRAGGFEVWLHREFPPGDGGLAYGQALVALARGGGTHVSGNPG